MTKDEAKNKLQALTECAETREEFWIDDLPCQFDEDGLAAEYGEKDRCHLKLDDILNLDIIREPWRWKPKIGEMYWRWFVTEEVKDGKVNAVPGAFIYFGNDFGKGELAIGNCFKTKNDCMAATHILEKIINEKKVANKHQAAFEKAKEIIKEHGKDEEALHSELDSLLCDILEQEGYGDLVKLFYESPKWYA